MSDLVPAGPYRAPLGRPRDEDEEARFVVQQELEPGEKLLWAGKPRQGVRTVPADAYVIPFGVVVLVAPIAVLLAMLVVGGVPAFFAALQYLLILLMGGVYLVGGRFVMDARRRAHTFYALTDRRAILVQGRDARRAISVPLGAAVPIALIDAEEGRGTIRFGAPRDEQTPVIRQLHLRRGAGPSIVDAASAQRDEVPTFEEIRDARAVYEQLREAQQALQDEQARAEKLP